MAESLVIFIPAGLAVLVYGLIAVLVTREWARKKRRKARVVRNRRKVIAAFFDHPPRDLSDWTTQTLHEWDEDNRRWIDVETGMPFCTLEDAIAPPPAPMFEDFSFMRAVSEPPPPPPKGRRASLLDLIRKTSLSPSPAVRRQHRHSMVDFILGRPEMVAERDPDEPVVAVLEPPPLKSPRAPKEGGPERAIDLQAVRAALKKGPRDGTKMSVTVREPWEEGLPRSAPPGAGVASPDVGMAGDALEGW